VADPDPEAVELLDKPILGHLGFLGLDGYPRVVTVWFRHADGELLIASRPGEYKCRSIRASRRAALTVATPEFPYLTINVVGEASVEPLPEKERIEFITSIARFYLAPQHADAYLQRWSRGGHPGDGELIRLKPRRYASWRS
jgi:hypothetical protein